MIRYFYRKHKARRESKGTPLTQARSANHQSPAPGATYVAKNEPDGVTEEPSKEEQKQEKTAARRYRWKLIAGLFLPYFIASTDVTSK